MEMEGFEKKQAEPLSVRRRKRPKIDVNMVASEDHDSSRRLAESNSWWKNLYEKPAAGQLGVHSATHSTPEATTGTTYFAQNSDHEPNATLKTCSRKRRHQSITSSSRDLLCKTPSKWIKDAEIDGNESNEVREFD